MQVCLPAVGRMQLCPNGHFSGLARFVGPINLCLLKRERGGGVGGSCTDEPDWSSRQMSTNKNVNDLGLLDFWDVESSLRLV